MLNIFTKQITVLLLLGSFSLAQAQTSASDRMASEVMKVGEKTFTQENYKPGLVRHIVLFRYAHGISATTKREVMRRFLALKNKCLRNGKPYILAIEAGNQNSGEGADQELEQGFIVSFKSEGDRNYYVGHPIVTDRMFADPAHDAFKRYVGNKLDKNGVIVFDFSI